MIYSFSGLSELLQKTFSDITAVSLLITNIIIIVFAILENVHIGDLVIVYWAQGVVLTFFGALKIIFYKYEVLSSIESPGFIKKSVSAFVFFGSRFAIDIIVLYFAIMFLSYSGRFVDKSPFTTNFEFILLSAITFFIAHLFSFLININKQLEFTSPGDVSISIVEKIMPLAILNLLALPIIIINTIATILFASSLSSLVNSILLILFMSYRTVTDLERHFNEHFKSMIKSGRISVISDDEELFWRLKKLAEKYSVKVIRPVDQSINFGSNLIIIDLSSGKLRPIEEIRRDNFHAIVICIGQQGTTRWEEAKRNKCIVLTVMEFESRIDSLLTKMSAFK